MKRIKHETSWSGALATLDLAASLNSLGNLALDQGDLTTAQELHQQALALREKLAPNSFDVAASFHNLGNVAMRRGNRANAWEYHQRALAIRRLAEFQPRRAFAIDDEWRLRAPHTGAV
jgi:Tfp pilus assembly protein PilF